MWITRTVEWAGLVFVLGACSSNSDSGAVPGQSTGGASRGGSSGTAQTSAGGAAANAAGGSEQGGSPVTDQVGGAATQATGGTATQASGGSEVGAGGGVAQAGGSGGTATAPSGGNAAGGACADLQAETTPLPPVLEFSIDITGSMANQPAYPSDPNSSSKWAEMVRVLPNAFASLPSDWAVGVSYFSLPVSGSTVPQCYAGTQAVPIAPLSSTQLGLIQNSVGGQRPSGATPTGQAWQFALSQISNWSAPEVYANSSRYIVLITDGIPTINNDGCFRGATSSSNGSDAIAEAEYDSMIDNVRSRGSAANVQTFVVGVLGSEIPQGALYDPLYKLSQLAVAGGTEQPKGCSPVPGTTNGQALTARGQYCHFDMTANPDFAAGLTEALRMIARQVVSCSYEVPTPSDGRWIDPAKILVTYTTGSGELRTLDRATDSSCGDGQWYVMESNAMGIPTKLQLCVNSCDAVASDPGAQIKITFTCIDQM